MNKLVIKQNTVTENVTVGLISKLYSTAKAIKDYEELNDVLNSQVELQGNLLVVHAYGSDVTYLEAKFPNLHINVTGGTYVNFVDPQVETILKTNNVGDGVGCTLLDLYNINSLNGNVFSNSNITSFNELLYFNPASLTQANLFANCSNLTEVTLPTGVTYIALDWFLNCSSLTTINNTHGITKIRGLGNCSSLVSINTPALTTVEDWACLGCTSLTTIDLSNCTSIGYNSFLNCASLNNIDLSSCTTLGERAFYRCSGLTSVDLSTVTSIGPSAFYMCSSLLSVTALNSSMTQVKNATFAGCIALSSIDLSNCTSIGNNAFLNCTALTSVYLSSCTSIGEQAFSGCTSLTSVTFPSVNYTLSGKAFYGCRALALDIDLTNCTNADMLDTFRNTFAKSGITSIKTSLYINKIGGYDNANEPLFFACSSLKKADLSQSTLLTSIDALRMFHGCKNLKYVKFPSTITEFKKEIFFNWSSESNYLNTIKIYLPCATPPTMTKHTLCDKSGNGVLNPTLQIYVPTNSISAYQADADWNLYTILDILNYSES